MFRKITVVILAVLCLGSFVPLALGADTAGEKMPCSCPKGCQCEHCRTGKGHCQWMTGEKCCTCPKDCQCEHCRTGQGTCICNTGGKGCVCCPKGCRSRTPGAAETPTAIANEKTVLSQRGLFKVSYTTEPAAVPVNSLHTWTLTIRTPDGQPVQGATIKVSGDMPDHGHGLPTQPQVRQGSAAGTYVVEGVKFSMPGWWNMIFGITASGKTDEASFNLRL